MKNAYEAIRDYSLNRRKFFELDDVLQAFPHLTQKTIVRTLLTYPEFIQYYGREFFNAAVIKLSEEETESIMCDIEEETKAHGYISGYDLHDIIQIKYPKVAENNSMSGIWRIIAALEYYSGGKYCFDRNIIFPKANVVTPFEVIENLLKGRKRFREEDAPENMQYLLTDWGEAVFFVSGLEIDKNVYASKEFARFDVEKIDAAIEALCEKKVFPLTDIDDFSSLPCCDFEWNKWLLKSYLYHYSKKYKIFFEDLQYKFARLTGIVTSVETGVSSFIEALALALKEEAIDLKLNEKKCVETPDWEDLSSYIVKRGYIVYPFSTYRETLRQLSHKPKPIKIIYGRNERSGFNG